jgi:hypothetical protein
MLIISIIIAIWLAKALIDLIIGFAEILYGLTLMITAALWYTVSKLLKAVEVLWRTATD